MSSTLAFHLLILGLSAAIALLLPHISPRQYFFAVTAPPGFGDTKQGTAMLRLYYARVLAGAAVALAAIFRLPEESAAATLCAIIAPLAIAFAAVSRARGAVRSLAMAPPAVRKADLAEDRLPRWIALTLLPFALPIAAADWLRRHWYEIPQRFPIHWNAAGVPNRWAGKSTHTVFAPLVYGCAMMLFLMFLAIAAYHWSRRGPQRLAMLKLLVAAVYLMAILFTSVGLMPAMSYRPVWLFAPSLAVVAGLVWWALRMAKLESEPTPDSAWILGIVYYNPGDAAVFVQKRIGSGYTFNFGNRMSWVLVGSTIAAFAGITWLWPG